MFKSFFPNPKLFFPLALAWAALSVVGWYMFGSQLGAILGLDPGGATAPVIGVAMFWSPSFLLLYIYYAVAVALFFIFFRFFSPHPWSYWSVLGSAFIL